MTENSAPRGKLMGMFIGAVVPFEFVGQFYKFLYEAGVDPKHFEQAPAYDQAQITKAVQAALNGNGSAPLQITDGTKRKRRRGAIQSGSFKGWLLSLITEKSRSRAELKERAMGTKWNIKSLDARLHDLVRLKQAQLVDGQYVATSLGSAIITPSPEERPKGKRARKPVTQEGTLLAYLEKQFPKSVPLRKLRALYLRKGWRPESASVALNVLKDRGQVIRVDAGVYQFVQQQHQENGANVQPSE